MVQTLFDTLFHVSLVVVVMSPCSYNAGGVGDTS